MYEIKLSVKSLVEFLFLSGNIDNRFSGKNRAIEGAKIHRILQKQSSENYTPEVFLSLTKIYNNIAYKIDGRADGIINDNETITVDEIKTVSLPFELVTEDFKPVNWAQVKCYAYFYCVKNNIHKINTQLTYYHVDTKEIKQFKKEFTVNELEEFYTDLLKNYEKWAKLQIEWIQIRNNSIKNLSFPFNEYRKGQRHMASEVYKTIISEKNFFCQAPTGIGKTMSSIFPSIKAIGEQKAEKIFYLTAKTITRQAAEYAINKLEKNDLLIKSITITAKDKICFCEEINCNPELCPYANGYYDRINDAIFYILNNERQFTRDIIENYSKKYMLCPYELSIELSLWCDIIICDYNYIFDPNINGVFLNIKISDCVFLIDEAHNLIDRAREMYSASLSKKEFFEVKKLLNDKNKNISNSLNKINKGFLAVKKLFGDENEFISTNKLDEIEKPLYEFASICSNLMEKIKNTENIKEILKIYFEAQFYLKISEIYNEKYITFAENTSKDIKIKLFCIDPSLFLNEILKKSKASILFSATLSPLEYFSEILGGNSDDKKFIFPSPFSQNNMKLLIADNISTKYNDREKTLNLLCEYIYKFISAKKGNYIIYFPSYKYMNLFYQLFTDTYKEVKTIIQNSNMNENDRENFIKEFDENNTFTLLGFCVLGGIYSEGIDLIGNKLIGTAIVGVGIPQICTEQNILKNYFNKKNGKGYRYAYQFPGMNKVLQAAGRVIRDENDKGIILLLDKRFTQADYIRLFPHNWSHYSIVKSADEIFYASQQFWNNKK